MKDSTSVAVAIAVTFGMAACGSRPPSGSDQRIVPPEQPTPSAPAALAVVHEHGAFGEQVGDAVDQLGRRVD